MNPKHYGRTLDLDYRDGHCAFCDEKLHGRKKTLCGSRECRADYFRCYRDREKPFVDVRATTEELRRLRGDLPALRQAVPT